MAVERSGHVWLRSVVMIVYLIGSEGFSFFAGRSFFYRAAQSKSDREHLLASASVKTEAHQCCSEKVWPPSQFFSLYFVLVDLTLPQFKTSLKPVKNQFHTYLKLFQNQFEQFY